MNRVSSKVVPLSYTEGGSSRDLIIIQRAIPSVYFFTDIRKALDDIKEEWIDNHYLPKSYGAFDCDGSTFTTHSKTISKKIVDGFGEFIVEVIIEHHIQANI
jgi:hypothetical protein